MPPRNSLGCLIATASTPIPGVVVAAGSISKGTDRRCLCLIVLSWGSKTAEHLRQNKSLLPALSLIVTSGPVWQKLHTYSTRSESENSSSSITTFLLCPAGMGYFRFLHYLSLSRKYDSAIMNESNTSKPDWPPVLSNFHSKAVATWSTSCKQGEVVSLHQNLFVDYIWCNNIPPSLSLLFPTGPIQTL